MLGRGLAGVLGAADSVGAAVSVGVAVSVGAAVSTGGGDVTAVGAAGADVGVAAPLHAASASANITPAPARTPCRVTMPGLGSTGGAGIPRIGCGGFPAVVDQ
jgi:hypothetical protein